MLSAMLAWSCMGGLALGAVASLCACTRLAGIDELEFGAASSSGSGLSGGGGGNGGSAGRGGNGGNGGSASPLGTALALQSSCASSSAPSSAALELGSATFTVEMWFSVSELVDYQTLLYRGGTSLTQHGWAIELGANLLSFAGSDGFNYSGVSVTNVIVAGRAYHLVAIREGTTGELWLLDRTAGDQQHVQLGLNSGFPAVWTSTERLSIGDQSLSQTECSGEDLDGVVDEVRIWSGRRMAQAFDQDYDERMSCDAPGLLASWSFEEGSGITVADCASGVDLQINKGTAPVDYQWIDSPFDDPP